MYSLVKSCRSCGGELSELFAYRPIPLVNKYCGPEAHTDTLYPLTLMQCVACGLVQIREMVWPTVLYDGFYPYVPSHSQTMLQHFDLLAYKLARPGRFVVDIGSSDGSLLRAFAALDCKVLGVEPAKNLCEVARASGIPSMPFPFSQETAGWLATYCGRADIVTATNVLANCHDLASFLAGVKTLLAEDGLFVVETPNFESLLRINSYDSVYHEHMCYFTPETLADTLRRHGFAIEDMGAVPIHGGSIRVLARPGTQSVNLDPPRLYTDVARRFTLAADRLHAALAELHEQGAAVVGYGAPAKATVLLSQAGVNSRHLRYVTDNIPYKQGWLLPGIHVPIKAPEALDGDEIDVLFVLPWNFRDEILDKLAPYRRRGVRVMLSVPTVEVLEPLVPQGVP